jgi:uncharacterized MAPEG superfamily protein
MARSARCKLTAQPLTQVPRMPPEIKMLAWSIYLGLAYVLIAAGLTTQARGLSWNVGNRDAQSAPLTGAAGRAQRACRNFLETFAFFAAAVLAVVLIKVTSPRTALGAELYFWARLVYLPVYVIGIPYLRSAVWGVSFLGILMLVGALL